MDGQEIRNQSGHVYLEADEKMNGVKKKHINSPILTSILLSFCSPTSETMKHRQWNYFGTWVQKKKGRNWYLNIYFL